MSKKFKIIKLSSIFNTQVNNIIKKVTDKATYKRKFAPMPTALAADINPSVHWWLRL